MIDPWSALIKGITDGFGPAGLAYVALILAVVALARYVAVLVKQAREDSKVVVAALIANTTATESLRDVNKEMSSVVKSAYQRAEINATIMTATLEATKDTSGKLDRLIERAGQRGAR